MDATSDGGFVLAGRTSSSSAGGYDIWLVKTAADGAEQWNRTFGGADDEEAYAVAQTRDGGYVVAGFTSSILREAYLLKTDPDGVEDWHRTIDAGGKDPTAFSVRPTIDGGYVFAGSTYTPDNPDDAWVVKTDASGEPEWQRELGGSGVDYGFAIAPTLDGGYILAGGTSDGIAYPGQASLWKLASSGDEEWTRAYARGVASSARAVVQTDDGGYAFAADVAGSESRTDIHLVRTDGAGSEEWRRAFGTGYAVPYSVQQTSDGGYVIGGEIGTHAEAYLVKVAPRLLLP